MPPLARRHRLATLAALFALGAGAVRAETVTVFAAASLKTALDEIAAGYEGTTQDDIVISYAGSSALARQIEQGAPADLFLSASTDWMEAVARAGRIDVDSQADLLGNALVLISHDPKAEGVRIGPDLDLPAMLGDGRLAMALVDAVPAGIYGKAALTSLGLWDGVAPRVAQADNVRAALALVAAGATPLGIVYATDAAAEPRVTVVGLFPGDSHPPIIYPAAALADAPAAAHAFLDHLRSVPARAVFETQGFRVLAD
ncbi:molybdate ABC transporter substrate-binding protein [Mesobaculum littorinae]|uniref:Molybdate-binding protein ModA n=1 Tax=Mesobaculum littorinae TaxID=2486419 RepID=A0A438AHF4_9RHOB|nr:molybdate ABC transporter substrate-binding protein [Mesobaculum littorinae]RVV98159.1 molybdate ABC transporter substrate-binding protein [Mesobaculum littorinae]